MNGRAEGYEDWTITGDIKDLPSNLKKFYCEGNNTISGDLESVPPNLMADYEVWSEFYGRLKAAKTQKEMDLLMEEWNKGNHND